MTHYQESVDMETRAFTQNVYLLPRHRDDYLNVNIRHIILYDRNVLPTKQCTC